MTYGLANPATPFKLNTVDLGGSLLAQEFPVPNLVTPLANGNNWVLSPTSPIDWSEWNVRVDYNLSHANTLMFRWTQDSWTNNSPNLYTNLWGDDPWPALESNWSQPSKQIMGRLTSTIGTTMVNDVEFAYSANKHQHYAGRNGPVTASGNNGSHSFALAVVVQDLPGGYSHDSGAVSALMVTARTCG